jgi:signal peptidase I
MVANAALQPAPSFSAVRRGLYIALCLCMFTYVLTHWVLWPVVISGDSMAPSYADGQPNYINKLAYWTHGPQRGDVVGVRVGQDDYLIKRIIGTPGDKIEFYRGTVIVNGEKLVEPYVQHKLLWWLDPVQLGPNDYFVMGDNRTYSILAAVSRDDILGKAVF